MSLDFVEKEEALFVPVYLDDQRLNGIICACLRWTKEELPAKD